MCNPTNMPLFDWNLHNDMMQKDPCSALKQVEKKVKVITIKNDESEETEKYY